MNDRIKRFGRIAAATLMAAGTLAATDAMAHSVGYALNNSNWTFSGAAQVDVLGMQTNVFYKPANQRLIVTFSAECAVDAPAGNTSAWLDVDIVLIDAGTGAVVYTAAPTVGSADAFCSANGTAGFDGWTSNSVTALIPYNFNAGNSRVGVKARLNADATGGWLGERMIAVSL